MGMEGKSIGEAGDAKCRTKSTGPSTWMGWLTSCWISVNRGLARRCATFAADPVTRLSSATTSCPRSRSRSQRWAPMNPAPPDTTDLITTDPPVDESEAAHESWIVDVSPVDQHRPPHHPLQLHEVQVS